ncbi:MAG: hypothetical protein WDM86_07460 [Rhizomicrobium sp.]
MDEKPAHERVAPNLGCKKETAKKFAPIFDQTALSMFQSEGLAALRA